MSGQRTFGERLKELREANELTVKQVAEHLRSRTWQDMKPSAAVSRVTNWERGQSVSVSREECRLLEMIVGATPGELWHLALKDPRKLDPEILDYFVGLLRERADDTESPPSRAALRALAHFGKE